MRIVIERRSIFLTLMFAGILLTVCQVSTLADNITFKTGFTKDVIIEDETETNVKFRKRNLVVAISRENIVNIDHATPAENEALRLEWAAEKERLEAERRRKKEEQERYREAKDTDDTVRLKDKWVSLEKLEKMWDEPSKKATKELETLPDFIHDLPDELKQRLLQRFRQMPEAERNAYVDTLKLVSVQSVRAKPAGRGKMNVQAVIVNRGDYVAREVFVGILCLDEDGGVLSLDTRKLRNIGPKQSRMLVVNVKADYFLVEDLLAAVVDIL